MTLKTFGERMGTMKRVLLGCVVLVAIVLTLLAFRLGRTGNLNSAAPAVTTGSAAGAEVQSQGIPTLDDGESATNQRTRPQQRPPDVKHQAPPIPVAEALPGTAGFVKSPFNDKIIDVRDVPSGTLVADPTFPAEEKRYLRVP